jgi:hypothetical protein
MWSALRPLPRNGAVNTPKTIRDNRRWCFPWDSCKVVLKRRRKGKSQIWGSKIWPRVLRDSDPKMTALARTSSNCKRQARPLVRESAPNQQTRNCFVPRQTDRLTVGRNITLTLSSTVWRVEFLDASLPGYKLLIELSLVFGVGRCRVIARKELG